MTNEDTLSYQERRGFDLNTFDFGGSTGFVLVKASIDKVSPILAEMFNGKLKTNVYGQELNVPRWLTTIHQYREHLWTIFYLNVCREEFVRDISQRLMTQCIYFQYEDTSTWLGYIFFDNGEEIEEYQFGPDYREEYEEFKELMEDEMGDLTSEPDPSEWDIDVSDYDLDEQFLFRSTERTVDKDDLLDKEKFMDDFFKLHDAWLPDWDYLPYEDRFTTNELSAEDFIRVDVIFQN